MNKSKIQSCSVTSKTKKHTDGQLLQAVLLKLLLVKKKEQLFSSALLYLIKKNHNFGYWNKL